jgi:hypothetical protein
VWTATLVAADDAVQARYTFAAGMMLNTIQISPKGRFALVLIQND